LDLKDYDIKDHIFDIIEIVLEKFKMEGGIDNVDSICDLNEKHQMIIFYNN